MSTASAQKRGNELLQKFMSGKAQTKSAEKNYSRSYGEDTDQYFEAVADGSRLAMAYSATKRKDKSFASAVDEEEEDARSSPLALIRDALLKLNHVDGVEVPQISSLLQRVEENLEKATATRSRVQNRLAYSVEKQRTNRSSMFGDDSRFDEPLTPSAVDKSHNRQRNTYMENQLDLNEAELEYYEKTINDLVDKLEAAVSEKEELQSQNASLNERLQRITLKSQEEVNAVRARSQEMVDDLREQLDRLKADNKALAGKAAAGSGKARDDELVADLRQQVEELQNELDDNRGEMDHLTSIIDDLRNKLDRGDAHAGASADAANREAEKLRRQVAALRDDLLKSEAEVDALNTKSMAFNTAIADLNSKNKRLQDQLASSGRSSQDRLLFGSPGSGAPSPNKAYQSPSGKGGHAASRVEASLRYDDRTAERQIVFTPARGGSSALNTSVHQRSVIKNYMSNQLDLNEEELQQYEAMINSLADKVEDITREKEQLQNEYNRLIDKAGDYDTAVQDFNHDLVAKDKVIESLQQQVERLEAAAAASGSSARAALSSSFLDSSDYPPSARKGALDHSFQSTNESFFRREDQDELRRLLSQREQQIKVHISNLQACQDQISEQKSAISTLKNQKAKLKTEVDENRATLEELAHRERAAWQKVHDVEARLLTATEEAKESRKQLDEGERTIHELRSVMEEMRAKNTSYRLQIEHRDVADLSHTTPSRPPRHDEAPPSTGGATPLKQRLNRTEAQVDELTVQLRLATKAKEDIQLELEKVQIRLQTKARQVDDFAKEVQTLREELDSRLTELDQLKLQTMKADAAYKMKVIDYESEIELLNSRLHGLETTNVELNEVLSVKHSEVHTERENNAALRALIDKFGENGDSQETFIANLKSQQAAMNKQLVNTEAELANKSHALAKYKVHCEQLERELRASLEASQHKEREFEQRRLLLENEAVTVKQSMDAFNETSQSHVTVLRLKLDSLLAEKAGLEASLKEQKATTAKLQDGLAARNSEYSAMQDTVAAVAEMVGYHRSKVAKWEESLVKNVSSRMSAMDSKLRSLSSAAHSVSHSLEHTLRDHQIALRDAAEQRDSDAAEKEDLWQKLTETRREVELLSTLLNDTKHQLTDQINISKTQEEALITSEEYSRIAARLNDAEQRAIQMSTEGAKAFARSAKSIAYLEGECSRLKTLVDHFRVVNVKLTGDLKAANEEGMQSKSLEHRIKMFAQDEQVLKERVSALEALLTKKDKELLDAVVAHREQEERRNEKFERELNKLNDALRQHQEKLAITKRENDTLRVVAEENEKLLRLEIDTVNEALRAAEKESLAQINRYEDSEYELRQLRSVLAEKDSQYAQAELQITMLDQDLAVERETHQAHVRDFNHELAERQHRIRHLEGTVSGLKVDLLEQETAFNQRDEEISAKLLKRAQADEENRQLRLLNDAQTVDVNSLSLSNEELRHKVSELTRELELLKETYSTLKNETLRRKTESLETAERSLSRVTDEYESASRELVTAREQLAGLKVALDKKDRELERLHSDFLTVQNSEQVFKATCEARYEENEQYRKQLEELMSRLTANSRDMSNMRSQISEQAEVIADYEHQVSDFETKLKNAKATITAIDSSEHVLAGELRAFAEAMFVGHPGAPQAAPAGPQSAAAGSFNIGADLFASPPLTVGRSTINVYTGDIETSHGDSLTQIKNSFYALRTKSETLVNTYNALHTAHDQVKRDKEEVKKRLEKAAEKLQLVTIDRDELFNKLTNTEADLSEVRTQKSALEHEKEVLVTNHEAIAQRAGVIMSDLDNALLEALSKANDAAAGIVSIDTEALPNLTLSQSVIPMKAKKVDSSIINVLNASVKEVDRASAYLISVIESLVVEFNAKKQRVEKAESLLDGRDKSWAKERQAAAERIAELVKEIEALRTKLSHSMVELESNRLEIDRLRHQVNDIARNNNELEGEFKSTSDINAELRGALNEAEAICMDLRSRIRVLQSEADKKVDECLALGDQLENVRKRATENELLHEKTSAMLGRVRAEKEALDNVRRSLESELDRSRSEVVALREQAKGLDESSRNAFEAEKLLAGLSTTLDQLIPVMEANRVPGGGSRDGTPERKNKAGANADSFKFTSPAAKVAHQLVVAEDANASLPTRVDAALKRLSLLRSLARDDHRNRRLLESTIETLTNENVSVQTSADDMQRQLKKALAVGIERENEIKDKIREEVERNNDIQRLKDEIARLKREGASLLESLEAERRGRQKLLTDLQGRDNEITRLGLDVDGKSNTIVKLQEQVSTAQDAARDAQTESKHRADQLKSAKQSNERMIETIDQLERTAEVDRRERENFERKLIEAENVNITVSRLRTRISELEAQLAKANEEGRSLHHDLVTAEERHQADLKEADAHRKKVTALELRIETIMHEKNTFVDDMAETRRKIAAAKEREEALAQQRLMSEAAVEALRKASEEKRFFVDEFTAKTEEIEVRQAQAEEEKRSLRSKIQELKVICDEKDSQYAAEAHDRLKLEKDLKHMKSSLAKKTQELHNSESYSSMLRTEGRQARKQVLEAVGQIREIVNVIRIDAQAVGVEITSPEPKGRGGRSASLGEFDEHSLQLGLGEALGINDLTSSLDAMRSAIVFVRSGPKTRQDLEALIRKLEAENTATKKELHVLEAKKSELVNQYKSELHQMQLQITDVRRTDSKNPHLTHQIGVLEASLRQERERREKAQHEIELLSARLEATNRDLTNSRHNQSNQSTYYKEMEALTVELDKQKAEYASVSQELNAVNHHRTVLRDTVEQLDRQLKQKVDALSDLQHRVDASHHHHHYEDGASSDEDALRRQVTRYKARSIAMDELAAIYRVSVLALYADGASYSAAQFGWQPHGLPQEFASKGVHVIGVGWIEKEVATVKHSYEDEIRLLDSEVSELRAKQRQSSSYIVELRKRYEESMMSIYRSGKGSSVEGAMQQFDQMRLALDNSQNEIHSLHQDLSQEKARSRQRHVQLVDDLTKTLQARDAALSALHRLEKYCMEKGVDIKGMAIYETLKSELSPQAVSKYRSFDGDADSRVVSNLVRGLVESDHEVAESERREHRRHREAHHSSSSHHRSTSHGSSGAIRPSTSANSLLHHSTLSSSTARAISPPKTEVLRGGARHTSPEHGHLSSHTRLSNGRVVVEEHLTESFLTDKGIAGRSERANLNKTAPAGSSAGRFDHQLPGYFESSTAADQQNNSSFQLHTVGQHHHTVGSSSLRVSRATSGSALNTSRTSTGAGLHK